MPRAKRLAGMHELDDGEISYWKGDDGVWLIYFPGCGAGRLVNHQITEHSDGTITARPSILMTSHPDRSIQRHGYLSAGVWEPCSDDPEVRKQ